jgi:DNA-binding beta-propeller fold protein YncE
MQAAFDRLEVGSSMGPRIPFAIVAAFCVGPTCVPAQIVDLPSSKQLIGEAPGHPQRINSLPISMAVSPDGRYIVTVNAGYGTYESKYDQSFSVLDAETGALADFPDNRTLAHIARQTLYSGLAFSRDGRHLYASMASLTDPGRAAPAGTKDPPARRNRQRRRRSVSGGDRGGGRRRT